MLSLDVIGFLVFVHLSCIFLYVQVWPIEVDLKFMEPVGRELKNIGKVKLGDISLFRLRYSLCFMKAIY